MLLALSYDLCLIDGPAAKPDVVQGPTSVLAFPANFDPEANPHAERLDLARRPNRHLAFGTGIHFCLGLQLARIEARCGLEALFKRWPGLELAVPPDAIRWRPRPGLRALERLPITTSPR